MFLLTEISVTALSEPQAGQGWKYGSSNISPKNCQLGICINYPGTKLRSIPMKYADNIKLVSMENKRD